MGQFSWITQDTGEAIRESYSCDDPQLTSAYLHDNQGNVWEEKKYEGYGVFGGKDFYALLAEMNEPTKVNGNVGHDRSIGIEIAFGDDPYISPNLTRNKYWTWRSEAPEIDPNQGWGECEDDYEEDDDFYSDENW